MSAAINEGDLYRNRATDNFYIVLKKRDNNSWSVYRINDDKMTWVLEECLIDPNLYVRLA